MIAVDAVAEVLAARWGAEFHFTPKLGRTLFAEELPEGSAPDEVLALFNVGGPSSVYLTNTSAYHRPGVQVVARAVELRRAFALAEHALSVLSVGRTSTNSAEVLSVTPSALPRVNSWDEEGRPLVSFIVETWMETT